MSLEMAAPLPPAYRPFDVVQAPIVQEPLRPPVQATPEQVRHVDAVFAASSDEQTDAALGLMGLTLAAPWLIDVVADALRPDRGLEQPRPRVKGKDEDDE
jgi:hypothetical protein